MTRDPSIPWLEPSGSSSALVDELPVGLFRLDAAGAVSWSNLAARDLLRGPGGDEVAASLPAVARRAAELGRTAEHRLATAAGELRLLVAPEEDGFTAVLSRDAMERAREQARALRAMLAGVASGPGPLEAATRGLEALGHALPDTQFVLYGREGGRLVVLARAARPAPPQLAGEGVSPEELAERAIQARQPIHVARIVRAPGRGAPGRRGQVAGSLALPVLAGRELVGAIYAHGPMLAEGDLRLVQGFADAAGSLLGRARGELALEAERSARAASEAAARRAREVAVQREGLATLGQLVACIAHEINNPLAALRSNLRGLASGFEILCGLAAEKEARLAGEGARPGPDLTELAGELREMMDDSLAGLDRMSGIIQTLKSMARRSPGQPTAFDPGVPVQEAVAVFRGARGSDVLLELELEPRLPEVLGLPGALAQVTINLLENAVDAMQGRGRVEVRARVEGPAVRVEVADEGHGIPADAAPQIFDPWFTTKPVGKGTGLGLYICKEIVEQMGGRIGFDTGPGGTTFRVDLPIAPGARPRQP
ncbi:sensor histidine kinase [Anaeromyxobacter paludicola]|uniref:histidine kinase n=1 Tax=Anaeromyxobacter paludicola TaxID=2918171 RepID=A0ABN6N445_9BACT|nr:ATP-binding protein [Anaeromyxobacter paludicola]BDG07961.1 hypothetical protein AMPC_10740 [Anaeromyxobacter paludicola]